MQTQHLGTKNIYQGRVVSLSLERLQLPNGHSFDLELVRHPGAAAIVPLRENGNVVMVRQDRFATGVELLELPAGKLDPHEQPNECAKRELREETGYSCEQLISLGFIWTSPGFTDEKIWLYLARGLSPATQSLDEDEVLTVHELPLVEAVTQALNGSLSDAKSALALVRAQHYLNGQKT